LSAPTSQQLLDLLYLNHLAIIAIALIQPVLALAIAALTGDQVQVALAVAGGLVGSARLGLLVAYRRRSPEGQPGQPFWENAYAAGSFLFAAVVALTCMRAFAGADPNAHMIAYGLLFTYGAGVVSRVAFKPWIANLSLVIAWAPPMVAMGLPLDLAHASLVLTCSVMLCGGFLTIRQTFDRSRSEIEVGRILSRMAHSDALTGLPNRAMFEAELGTTLRSRRQGETVALHFFDLDGFKAANDAFGHQAGDEVLREVAARLRGLAGPQDIVARFAGDEFVLIQPGISRASDAESMARRIVKAIATPFSVGAGEVAISASVGIALASRDDDPVEFVRRADAAMYDAKHQRRGSIAFAEGRATAFGTNRPPDPSSPLWQPDLTPSH